MTSKALLVSLLGLAAASTGSAQAACGAGLLQIDDGRQGYVFNVEVADDYVERQRGLMFVEQMAPDAGMLFVFDAPQRTSFWMRNTLIPLDMLFADSQGRVTRLHADAIPMDETPIFGGDNVRYVLEINGGMSEKLGLQVGDQLIHSAIGQIPDAWACE